MKKKNPESKLLKQNHLNDYDERFHMYDQAPPCQNCCCESCTGFGCPWLSKYEWKYESFGNKYEPRRCDVCRKRKFEKIFDCDYYTYYRRRKFFVPKRYRRPKTELELIKEKLELIMKLLEQNGKT